jgi:hypothetical protein
MDMLIKDKEELERLVDGYQLSTIIDVLAQICLEKSEHIQSNWSNTSFSKAWLVAGMKLDQVKNTKPIKAITFI